MTLEAPPGFEPGMEVLQISLGSLSCRFVLLSGLWCSAVFSGIWALMARSLARGSGCHPSTVWMFSPLAAVPLIVRRTCPEGAQGQRERYRLQVPRAASRGAPRRRCEADGAQRTPRDPESGPPRVRTAASCHPRDDDGPEMIVQFVRRHDHARSRFRISLTSVGSSRTRWTGPRPIADRLPPLLFLAIERGGRRFVEESVVAASPHAPCRRRPPAASMTSGLNNQPAGLGVELRFFRKIRFIDQRLGNPNPPRIVDPDDARLRRHWDYSVAIATSPRRSGKSASGQFVGASG